MTSPQDTTECVKCGKVFPDDGGPHIHTCKGWTLETFILHGPEREVDAWWAEHGMGLDAMASKYPREWTTDRGLRYVIEDRVGRLGVHDLYCMVLRRLANSVHIEVEIWTCLRATNRQVILAAARAMSLVFEAKTLGLEVEE